MKADLDNDTYALNCFTIVGNKFNPPTGDVHSHRMCVCVLKDYFCTGHQLCRCICTARFTNTNCVDSADNLCLRAAQTAKDKSSAGGRKQFDEHEGCYKTHDNGSIIGAIGTKNVHQHVDNIHSNGAKGVAILSPSASH
jgi:hypothetical protein